MKTVRCATCGMSFGLPDEFYEQAKEDGRGFACPLGHRSVFRPSENDLLREQVEKLEKRAKRLEESIAWYSNRASELYDETKDLRQQLGVERRRVTNLKKKLEQSSEIETQKPETQDTEDQENGRNLD